MLDSIFQSGANDVSIFRKNEIAVQEEYLPVSIVTSLRTANPLEEAPFVYPFNVAFSLDGCLL